MDQHQKECRSQADLLTDEEVLRLISSNVKQIVSGLLEDWTTSSWPISHRRPNGLEKIQPKIRR